MQTGGVLCASSDQKGIDLRQKKRKRFPNLFQGRFCSFFALNPPSHYRPLLPPLWTYNEVDI
ncbi:hypothetical protein DSZ78_15540 [Escherichia coli]|nr:hypothetical protein [Escherichia coli]EEW4305804.1 hypothetical protein [Escherichia coli]EEW4349496.1 hypothetical protein [Escherichia coli]EFO2258495.1 hypothetical protein [Escherichia coli]